MVPCMIATLVGDSLAQVRVSEPVICVDCASIGHPVAIQVVMFIKPNRQRCIFVSQHLQVVEVRRHKVGSKRLPDHARCAR